MKEVALPTEDITKAISDLLESYEITQSIKDDINSIIIN